MIVNMNRLGILGIVILLSGCCTFHQQQSTDRKTVTKTVMPVQKMETISLYTGATCCEPIPNEDPAEKAKRRAEESREYKDMFSERWGVTWPEGSSIEYKDHAILHVTNTAENLLKIIRNMSQSLNYQLPQIEMDVQIIETGKAALDAVGINGQGHIDAASEKREMLMRRDDVRLMENFHIITQNGQECVTKAVTEYIYPTEYVTGTRTETTNDASCVSGNTTVVPANFELREVGTCFEMVPELSDLGNQIRLMMHVTVTGEPTWKDYSQRTPKPETDASRLPMEQPFFPNQVISTALTIAPEQTLAMVMGGFSRTDGGSPGKTLILFLTPHLIHRHGSNIFTPVRLAPEP